ncbi:MAG: replication initiator protein [Microvirus sp.]|nr:MAG: replication initiator protein [Microvirus sp.]
MTCYSPLHGFRGREGKFVFKRSLAVTGQSAVVACGQCIGCRLDRSRSWALRCMHEAQLYWDNCFITLTYSNESLPEGETLVLKHFQDFMKRLRSKYEPRIIRFYACGEYGELFERPHYHACLFNFQFADRVPWKKAGSGEMQFRSPSLEKLWPYGFSSIGSLTWSSAAYCARYIMQKQTGANALKYSAHVDPVTGAVYSERLPPFNVMSRRPGIGHDWLTKYVKDAYPSDFLVHETRKVSVPRYYDSLFERMDGDLEGVRAARRKLGRAFAADRTPERLAVREQVKLARVGRLTRDME